MSERAGETVCQVPYTDFEWLRRGQARLASAGTLDEPCPACGHMAIAHPGPGNPSIDGCLLCRLVAAAALNALRP